MAMSQDQKAQFDRDGFTILEGLFDGGECDRFVQHMMDLHAGKEQLDGFSYTKWAPGFGARDPEDWSRTRNQHLYDPMTLDWMLDLRLRQPLRDCLEDEPDAIQTMYFYQGSEQSRHQDAYHLPFCISAWIALQDIAEGNGSIYVQVGSHNGPTLDKKDFRPDAEGVPGAWQGRDPGEAFESLFEGNRLPEVPVRVSKGDTVLFHGRLIHRGGPILEKGAFRHTLACHYIPHNVNPWAYEVAPRLRISFDRACRFTPVS